MTGESVGLTIPRNYFNLDQEHVFSMEAGLIYPIYQMLLMPGDVIKVSNQAVIRQQPTVSPSFSRFKIKFWDFVVAIRNLDKNIYRFMSGFEEYTSEVPWTEPLPKWIPTDISKTRPGTLWDMLENPVNCIPDQESAQIDYFRQAYGYIWDLYFRNETRQNSILEKGQPGSWKGEDLLRVNWDRDYITTSLPKQILGEPMAVPIQGVTNAVFDLKTNTVGGNTQKTIGMATTTQKAGINVTVESQNTDAGFQISEYLSANNVVDFANAGTILLSQLTEMLAIETMQMVNAIAGIRDDEFLKAHWGVSPSNEALQYPEIFGKESANILTSEVLQTSQSTQDSALGDMGGHGIGVAEGNTHSFHAKEFSVYLKLAYIKPETTYGGQGTSREYTENTMYDFPFVELNHIAMQPIYAREILCASSKKPMSTDNGITITAGADDNSAKSYNNKIIGYQPNFAWFKEKRNRVSGLLKQEQFYKEDGSIGYKDNLFHWTEARFFSIKDGERPLVNNDFLQCKVDNRNYQIVDDTIERSQFIVWHKNSVDAWRSISSKSLPSNLSVTQGMR